MFACKCPSDIDTPKDINPTEFSNVFFINALPDFQKIRVINNNRFIGDIFNYEFSINDYQKFNSGSSNMTVTNFTDSLPVFSTMLNLEKDSNYTLVTYGKSNRNYSMIIKDKKLNYNKEKAYLRFIHASIDAPAEVTFKLIESFNLEFKIKSRSYTEFLITQPTDYYVSIVSSKDDSLLLDLGNIKIENGKCYTFLLKGLESFSDKRKLKCQIISRDL